MHACTSSGCGRSACHGPEKVSHAMNERLMRQFQSTEVECALFAMAPNKAPGYDGFYQRNWDLIKMVLQTRF